jgi:hypothetical protein
MFLAAIVVNAGVGLLTLNHTRRRARQANAVTTRRSPEPARSAGAGRVRQLLFIAVYYSFLPIGKAQALLASLIERVGLGLGWPLLILWWPLRQAYRVGFHLCRALRP